MLPEFPRLRSLLLENDDGEDIVSGLRKLVADVRTNWRSPYSATKSEQEKLWKKLSPQQQAALREQLHLAVLSALSNVSQPIRVSGFNPTSKLEANVIHMTFRRMANDLQHIGPALLERASVGPEPIVTPEEAQLLKGQYNAGGIPMDRELGQVTLNFVNDHQKELTRLVMYEDDGAYGFDIYTVPTNLATAISKTPKNKQKEALQGVHYLLLRMARQFADTSVALQRQYSGQSLPAEPSEPGKPDGGIKPVVTKR